MPPKVPRGCWSTFQQRSQPGEDPERGKFGSLLSLATAQEAWPLWSKGLGLGSGPTHPAAGPVLSSPCPSLERDPSTAPSSPSREHQFHSGHLNLCCPLVAEQAQGGNKGCLQPPLSFLQPLLPRAGQSQGDTGPTAGTLCLSSAVSVWDISSGMGSVAVSC